MNKNDLLNASDILKKNKEWHIFTHKKSDGDALGSANALIEAGIINGHIIKWFSPDKFLPAGYSFLPHFNLHISAQKINFHEDNQNILYVFLDCSNEFRSVEGFIHGINSLNIDHHEDNTFYGKNNCVDGKASSTCEVLFRIFEAGNWNMNINIAESLYTGMFTDTGSFSFSNTSALTHNIAAKLIDLGVSPAKMTDLINQTKTYEGLKLWSIAMSRIKIFGENHEFALSYLLQSDFHETNADMTQTEGLPSMMMTIMGVKLAAMLTENENIESVRVSLRSRNESPVEAGETARIIGGGGHKSAAGATLNMSMNESINELQKLIMTKYYEFISSNQ